MPIDRIGRGRGRAGEEGEPFGESEKVYVTASTPESTTASSPRGERGGEGSLKEEADPSLANFSFHCLPRSPSRKGYFPLASLINCSYLSRRPLLLTQIMYTRDAALLLPPYKRSRRREPPPSESVHGQILGSQPYCSLPHLLTRRLRVIDHDRRYAERLRRD